MLRGSKVWDVRCPQKLANMFVERTGYYYKINRQQSQRICRILSREYGVRAPRVVDEDPPRNRNAECTYLPRGMSEIRVHARGHMKLTFHEWYHHLDHATGGRFNSSDRSGGAESLAWKFADMMFDALRAKPAKLRKAK
jgi:hypothetical protein